MSFSYIVVSSEVGYFMYKKGCGYIVLVLFLLSTSTLIHQSSTSEEVSAPSIGIIDFSQVDHVKSQLEGLIPHDPIVINDVSNFSTLGFSGDGTATNPYLIQGLEIESTDSPCISIYGDFSVYYTISGCRFSGTQTEMGWIEDAAVLLRAGNASVINCEILDAAFGITITKGDATLENISVWDCEYEVLNLRHAQDVDINNCTFLGEVDFSDVTDTLVSNSIIGDWLSLSLTSDITFHECSLSNCYGSNRVTNCVFVECVLCGSVFEFREATDMVLDACNSSSRVQFGPDSNILGCIFNTSSTSIMISPGGSSIVGNILLGNNSGIGISVLGSSTEWTAIRYNTIVGFNVGINIQCDNAIIIDNTVSFCTSGIYVTGSETTIYGNHMFSNSVHATDYGRENQWDDGISTGNYYGMRLVIGPVVISGTAGAIDRFPMNGGIIGYLVLFELPLFLAAFVDLVFVRRYRSKGEYHLIGDSGLNWRSSEPFLLFQTGLPFAMLALGSAFIGGVVLSFSNLPLGILSTIVIAGFILYRYGPPNSAMLMDIWGIPPATDEIDSKMFKDMNRRFMLEFFISYGVTHLIIFSGVIPDVWALLAQIIGLICWTIYIGYRAYMLLLP